MCGSEGGMGKRLETYKSHLPPILIYSLSSPHTESDILRWGWGWTRRRRGWGV